MHASVKNIRVVTKAEHNDSVYLFPYEGYYTENGEWISVKSILVGLGLVTTWLLYFKYRDRNDKE